MSFVYFLIEWVSMLSTPGYTRPVIAILTAVMLFPKLLELQMGKTPPLGSQKKGQNYFSCCEK